MFEGRKSGRLYERVDGQIHDSKERQRETDKKCSDRVAGPGRRTDPKVTEGEKQSTTGTRSPGLVTSRGRGRRGMSEEMRRLER